MQTYDCPHAEVCKTCPCAAEDDACFPGERLRAEVEHLREALREIVATQNTRHICKRHGGDGWAGDNDDECWCGVFLDAEDKMRKLAGAALSSSDALKGKQG